MPALGANQHRVRAAYAVWKKRKTGGPVLRKFHIASQARDGRLLPQRENAGRNILRAGRLGFHNRFLWVSEGRVTVTTSPKGQLICHVDTLRCRILNLRPKKTCRRRIGSGIQGSGSTANV